MAIFSSYHRDPHQWPVLFHRTAIDVDTTPPSDTHIPGGASNAVALVHIEFRKNANLVTYQVFFWNPKLNNRDGLWLPGPTYTKSPTDEPEGIAIWGSPIGILVKDWQTSAADPDDDIVFAVDVMNGDLGGI